MTTRDLATLMAHELGVSRLEAEKFLQTFSAITRRELMEGEDVPLTKMGRLFVRQIHGKFRVKFHGIPSFSKDLDENFVENRDL